MHVVITTVRVQDGSIPDLAALFDETNRDLVAGEDDWFGAWFTANHETNEVTVIARWTDPASYERLRSSPEFSATMGRFAEKFAGPPAVTVNEVLVEM